MSVFVKDDVLSFIDVFFFYFTKLSLLRKSNGANNRVFLFKDSVRFSEKSQNFREFLRKKDKIF